MIELLLPYPPSSNRYYRNFRGVMVRSKDARAYCDEVERIASEAGCEQTAGCVKVALTLHPRKPKDWERRLKKDVFAVLGLNRLDLDNAQKVTLDSLQGVAFENDRQVTDLRIRLGQPIEGGGITAQVSADDVWEHPV
jgi:crossover junction endodeoxyribonuclease RusA